MTVKAQGDHRGVLRQPAKYAYWNGCSAGGRQAMKEAQKFPADFDGIIAGSPGLDWTGRAAGSLRIAQVTKDEAARIPAAKAQLLHKAVLEACDAIDGIKDGVIDDPDALQVRSRRVGVQGRRRGDLSDEGASADRPADLHVAGATPKRSAKSPASRRAASSAGPTSGGPPRRDRPASISSGSSSSRIRAGIVDKFNFETDIVRAEETDADTINALDPNLKAFFDRGGKLIQYHGWSDPQISPGNSVAVLQARRRSDRRHGESRRRRTGCSWRRAWGTAAAAKARTPSTWSPRSSSGSSSARRRPRSSPRTAATARSIARARSARIRRSRIQGQRQHRRSRELCLRGEVRSAGEAGDQSTAG